MQKKGTQIVNTPLYYPPWFESYEAFRTHVNDLAARKEAEIRAKAEGR